MPSAEHGAPRKWLTLLAMTGSLCMILLDVTVVGVSLPAMQSDLHLTDVQTQWVVNAYVLAMASLVALGGRSADVFGKVPTFLFGVTLFAGASIGCALASGAVSLVGWRVVQGVAAAIMQPASASLVVDSFAPGERGKAMAVYAGIPMVFLAAGPPIGGALTQFADWTWNFWINVPIAGAALVMTSIARPIQKPRPRQGRDPIGTIMLLVGLPCFIYGLMQAHSQGWGNPVVLATIGTGVVMLPVFISWERRHPTPLLAVQLFADTGLLVNGFILFAVQFAMNGLVIFGSSYLQVVLEFDPFHAGLALLPLLLPILVVIHIAGRMYDRVGIRKPALIGTGLATLGMALQTIVAPMENYPLLALGMVILGTGIGFVMSPTNVDTMSRAGAAYRAQASGLAQTCRQVGGTLGIAVVGAAILMTEHSMIDSHVQSEIVPAQADATRDLMQHAARGDTAALNRMKLESKSLQATEHRIVGQAVAVGWGISTAALAMAFVASWRGFPRNAGLTLQTMPRPIIGISCDLSEANALVSYRVNRQYVKTVHEAGGVAVLLTHEPGDALELIDAVDGVLLTGGRDIDVRKFGQELHPKAEVMDADRQAGEWALLDALDQRPDKPVLGICLGMQMMGVHRGCPLVQHIADVIPGGERHQGNQQHEIEGTIGKGTITSSHHQMLGAAGPFTVLARSSDGCVEAIELPGRALYFGVQWHPERTKDAALGVGIVKKLVDAAAIARAARQQKVNS